MWLTQSSLRSDSKPQEAVVVGGPAHLKHVTQVDHPMAEDLDDMPLDCLAKAPHVMLEELDVRNYILVVVPLR